MRVPAATVSGYLCADIGEPVRLGCRGGDWWSSAKCNWLSNEACSTLLATRQ